MWKQVLGVQTDLQNQEFQAWLDTFYAGNWEVFNDNLVGDFPGPETYLDLYEAELGSRLQLEKRRL